MFDEESYSDCYLDNERVKKSNASKRTSPIFDRCMKGTTYARLGESKFYDRFHDAFTFFLIEWIFPRMFLLLLKNIIPTNTRIKYNLC